MPRFDGTGPAGAGPMTGRRAGNCTNEQGTAAYPQQGLGLGRGRGARCLNRGCGAQGGRGFGRGRGAGFGQGRGFQKVPVDKQLP